MTNLLIGFLALLALFMGGCSILYIGGVINSCWINYDSLSCPYAGLIMIFAVPILFISLLIGWAAWRGYKASKK